MLIEINIDALVGPTHHFGGLGVGNMASVEHRQRDSYPRQAALEGIAKAALVARLGVPQFVWLPPMRPRWDLLSQLGFRGAPGEQLSAALHTAPRILSAAYSSSFMWAANAATVSPAVDAADGRYHLTPANLISSWHRATETGERVEDMRRTFAPSGAFKLHAPLPNIVPLRDEGAANHMRLSDPSGRLGFNVFVYGEDEQRADPQSRFPPRHTRAASEAIARLHRLDPETTFFLRQHPEAVSQGVFHNDVIATSHQGFLIHHELAFLDSEAELKRLEESFRARTGLPLLRVEVGSLELPLPDAVRSYFFNSQILSPTVESLRRTIVCPAQCREIEAARNLIERLLADPRIPLDEVLFVSLGESMANGGGPACLRLRVPVDQRVLAKMPAQLRMGSALEERLSAAIERWYPERVGSRDLIDPDFAAAAEQAVRELARAVAE